MTSTVHRSLLEPSIPGVIALGGGEMTMVFVIHPVVTVLLLLLSVLTVLVVWAFA